MRGSKLFAVLLFLSLCAQVALAETYSGGTSTRGGGMGAESFTELKSRILRMIDERKARMEQEKACVEAASNEEELRKCRPAPPMGAGGRGPTGMQQRQAM